jgi:hypothetical protein
MQSKCSISEPPQGSPADRRALGYQIPLRIKTLVWFTVFVIRAGFLFAQTADEMDRILDAEEITYSQAARFVLMAANVLPPGADAFTAARENRWLGGTKADTISADSPVSLGELSLLVMKAFNLKGGILYSFFPTPRYACRELVYLRIIQGKTDPGGRVDGRALLQILGRMLTYTGDLVLK